MKSTLYCGICAMAVLLAAGCQPPDREGGGAGVPAREPVSMPQDVRLALLDGSGDLALSSLKGAPAVLYILSSWNDNAKASAGAAAALQSATGMRVIPVFVDADAGAASEIAAGAGLTGACAVSAEELAGIAPVRALPTAVLLGADGSVLNVIAGYHSGAELAELTAEAVSNR